MNRDILFRSKNVTTGKWRYGYLIGRSDIDVKHQQLHYIFDDSIQRWYEIDSSTTCQYTGLTDKFDVKIFEGDIIVDYEGMDLRHCRYVYWDNKQCGFYTKTKDALLSFPLGDINIDTAIVIGNIFDNSELI